MIRKCEFWLLQRRKTITRLTKASWDKNCPSWNSIKNLVERIILQTGLVKYIKPVWHSHWICQAPASAIHSSPEILVFLKARHRSKIDALRKSNCWQILNDSRWQSWNVSNWVWKLGKLSRWTGQCFDLTICLLVGRRWSHCNTSDSKYVVTYMYNTVTTKNCCRSIFSFVVLFANPLFIPFFELANFFCEFYKTT